MIDNNDKSFFCLENILNTYVIDYQIFIIFKHNKYTIYYTT